MHERYPAPVANLFERQTGKFHPLAVEVVHLAIRPCGKDFLRHRLGQKTKSVGAFTQKRLAFLQSFIGLL